jgi:hypothetical protein
MKLLSMSFSISVEGTSVKLFVSGVDFPVEPAVTPDSYPPQP